MQTLAKVAFFMSGMECSERPYIVLFSPAAAEQGELMKAGFERKDPPHTLRVADSADDLRAYLWREGAYANEKDSPRPGVVLIGAAEDPSGAFDLILEIKGEPDLRRLMINLLLPEAREELLGEAYSIGVSACMVAPKTDEEVDGFWERCFTYWDQTHLPHKIIDMGA